MDGVFMRKIIRRTAFCMILAALVWTGSLAADREILSSGLIRLHVVANSDSEEDQSAKLIVRDAVSQSLREGLSDVRDVQAARTYLVEKLPEIQRIAKRTLESLGSDDSVSVSFCKEAFETRVYDTFSLPAGIYEALRIVIGKGEGKNWWCVTFPALCVPDSAEEFRETAVCAGFSESLTYSLSEEDYEMRFFLLDVLGEMEKLLFIP